MRKVVVSVGDCLEGRNVDADAFMKRLAKDLSDGEAHFEGLVYFGNSQINERMVNFFDSIITGMSSVLSMAVNAFHASDEVDQNALYLSRNCDRVFFNESAKVKEVVDFSKKIKIGSEGERIQNIQSLRYIGANEDQGPERFVAFPGCAKNALVDFLEISNDEIDIFGDVSEFQKLMRQYSEAENDKQIYDTDIKSLQRHDC